MTGLRAIAKPYAKAAFSIASENHLVLEWSELLTSASLLVENPLLKAWLKDPTTSSQQILTLFFELLPELSPPQQKFLLLLVEYQRLQLLPEIKQGYDNLLATYEKRLLAQIVSAYELTESEKSRLQQALEKHFSKTITMSYQVDPAILGGAIVRIGDQVFDGSGRRRLKIFQEQLRGFST